MNFGIIGFGAIGRQRYEALINLKKMGYPIDKIFIYDPYGQREDGYLWVEDVDDLKNKNISLIIIATPHNITPTMIEKFSPTGIKMLAEKPFCSSYEDALHIFNSLMYKNQLYIGFNYRFFDGIEKMFEDFQNGIFGKIYGVNIELGHGQSPKDKSSWKNNAEQVLGGSLLDPGIHVLDLIYTMDKSLDVKMVTQTKEGGLSRENNVVLVGDKLGVVNLQTSLVRWKNIFKFQINGNNFLGKVEGRGGNYGVQKYSTYKKWAWMDGLGENKISESDCKDSFTKELEAILFSKYSYIQPCTAKDALGSMFLYKKCMDFINDNN